MITHTFHPTALISPRFFISLSISARHSEQTASGFVTVQIPLTHRRGLVPDALRAKITASAPRGTIFASYASVEQVVSAEGRVEWTMATTSDAGGAIPQWVQRSWTLGGVPKAIVADVGLFIAWTARRRTAGRSVTL
ncbi:hypothetical protein N8T08_010038 [Aspergillus melleus]|uniref:Uncharacterized protein n=1 Tax=Aspergillus melleus TaxID=138277 RepID=A0ACC3ASS3_9EURO|nr:hypothetical protein N8T08_010038 [Aspergillus melleus]